MKKYQNIYQHISSLVDDMPPGQLLPSVRDLMDECSVSQVTVTRALKDLKKEGRIFSKVGEGTFKAGERHKSKTAKARNIVMLLPDYPSTFVTSVQASFKSYFYSQNYKLKTINYDYRANKVNRSMVKGSVDALIIYVDSGFDLTSVASISELGMPVVFINIMPQGVNIDAVCTDNEYGGALAAECLLNNNHKKIAMLIAQPLGQTSINRRRGFSCRLELAGINDMKLINCETVSGENSTEKAYRTMLDLIDNGQVDFTGIFTDSDLGALGIIKACHDRKIKVPEQLSVIGFDDIPECDYFYPSLTSINQNLQKWAIESEKIINKRFNGVTGMAIQHFIKPTLSQRQSTGNIE